MQEEGTKLFLCHSQKDEGYFLLWRWEVWSIGGGGGCQWFFLDKEINIGDQNILWLVFKIQRYLK